jgi:hypothetical protein
VPLLAALGQLNATARAAGPAQPDGALDLRSLEDFGAAGDYDPAQRTGTDDTRAIQTAIDWAFGDGKRAGRAISVAARNYLCGPITTYPYTTLIGTGRQTSSFFCLPGTSGKWWSDRGRGAQKLMLSGLAWYGQGEKGLTAVCDLGTEGTPFGTEGILEGLWMRDAPAAVALRLNGNGGIVRDITVQSCDVGIRVNGNGNQIENVIAMQNRVGADFSGSFVRGLHLEATASGGLPLRINGDCRVRDILISSAKGFAFDRLIEVDRTNYDEWSLEGIHLLGSDYAVRRGMIAIGNEYWGGTVPAEFTGSSYLPSLDIHSGRLALDGQAWHAFSLEIAKRQGRLQHRIGSLGNPALPAQYAERVRGARNELSVTPVRSLRAGGGLEADRSARFVLDLVARQDALAQSVQCVVQLCSAGRALTALARVVRTRTDGGELDRLAIEFYDAASGAPFALADLPEGGSVQVGLSGFIG